MLTLFHCTVDCSSGKEKQRAIFSFWLTLINKWRDSQRVVELGRAHELRRDPTPAKCDGVDFSCNVAVQCVLAILRYALDQTFVLEEVVHSSSEEMAAMIVSQESRYLGQPRRVRFEFISAECSSHSAVWHGDRVHDWISVVVLSGRRSYLPSR
jgi:hypothetical protein